MKSPWAIPNDPRIYEGDFDALREEHDDDRRSEIQEEEDNAEA